LEFSPSSPADAPAIADFLLSVFQSAPGAPFVDPALLEWKYYVPHPDWEGSRSFVLRQGNQIVAHGCLFPVTLLESGRATAAHHLIDWAARRDVPGAGLRLVRELARLSPVLLTIGGSVQTRQILPKIGYRGYGAMEIYARVVRPWLQFRTDPFRRGWKAPLRVLRNLAWSRSRIPAPLPEWSAERIASFDDSCAPLLAGRAAGAFVSPRRTSELLHYLLRCPAADLSAYLLRRGQVPRGWFLLSRIAAQVRIADLWVDAESPEEWRSAFTLAMRAAAGPGICEVTAAASIPPAAQALRENGFRRREVEPVFLYDPRKLVAEDALLNLTLLDGDAFYRQSPDYPYLT
jgi:hypothetical protein